MTLSAGVRLGPYEVIALIGSGGMGEVYKARDTRLHRLVAIKVLPAAWSTDPDRRARFNREARTVATLSHPGICAIHDVGHQDNIDYLVLEYLEGETLAARLGRLTTLPIDEALRVATQIVDALAAAHRAGVIHRDLKPGNVMLTETGVKVLDFGLAKVVDSADAVLQTTAAAPPSTRTQFGAIAGTLPYMSPEQIEGRSVDGRSDLFALGAIVYEMVTGQRAFQGASQASVIAAILERTPPSMQGLQARTPPALERLVLKCLLKDPDSRWRSADNLADELRGLAANAALAPRVQTQSSGRLRRGEWLAIVLGMALAAVVAWKWRPTSADGVRGFISRPTHERVTFAGDVQLASLSPDGASVAYATRRDDAFQVTVRDVTSGRELEIWKGSYVSDLKWLRNNAEVLVAGVQPPRKGIFLVSRLGGAARQLDFNGVFVATSPDGRRVAWANQDATQGVNVAPLTGGQPRRIALADTLSLHGLDWSQPDRLLVNATNSVGTRAVFAGSPDREALQEAWHSEASLLSACGSAVDDAFYVSSGGEVRRHPFLGGRAQSSTVILAGLAPSEWLIAPCSISADGQHLLQVRFEMYTNLWRLDLHEGRPSVSALTKGTTSYNAPQFSRDGQWIVYSGGPKTEIAKMPSRGGTSIPLTEGGAPQWSLDGQRLGFLSWRNGKSTIWIGDADGRRAAEVPGVQMKSVLWTWFPGNRIAWQSVDGRNYQIRDLTDGRIESLVTDSSAGGVLLPRFNARLDSVAIAWNRPPRAGLWLLSWPGRTERFLAPDLIPDGWSHDDSWIYAHRLGTAKIVRVSAATGAVEPVGEFPFGSIPIYGCDVAPDGTAIVCSVQEYKSDAWLTQHFR